MFSPCCCYTSNAFFPTSVGRQGGMQHPPACNLHYWSSAAPPSAWVSPAPPLAMQALRLGPAAMEPLAALTPYRYPAPLHYLAAPCRSSASSLAPWPHIRCNTGSGLPALCALMCFLPQPVPGLHATLTLHTVLFCQKVSRRPGPRLLGRARGRDSGPGSTQQQREQIPTGNHHRATG